MPNSYPLPLSIAPATQRDAADHAYCEPVRAWQAHVSAGRIGGNPPTPPAVAAQLEANEALFRGIARDRRRLAQTRGT